ncbi:MAG: CRISPR-associated endonuclease Cas2 [Actinobacteria bacterium]|jgi:CRISPR-associated protein Cas2|nr:CRISPR-associated endonuclease Cas2 [Actinomycetota bacterium]
MATRRRHLVAYDIRDPKRLRQVHKVLISYGYPVQYSVFICDLTNQEKTAFRWSLEEIIEHRLDSVVLVDLGEAGSASADRFECLGVALILPDDGGATIV